MSSRSVDYLTCLATLVASAAIALLAIYGLVELLRGLL
jgi:hypothetical protein